MRGLWIIALASTSACIEGVDPNDCGLDADCGSGRVCSGMRRCALPDEVHDITVHWTIDGIVPTLAMPGRCSEVASFAVGAGDGGSGYIESTTCANGTALLVRVPRELAMFSAFAYGDAGHGDVRVLGQASSQLPPDGDQVMLDVVLP